MKCKIQTKNIELTESIKGYVEDKMNMLDKYLGNLSVIHCDVIVGTDSGHHNKGAIYKAEINLDLPGEMLSVTKTEEDLYKAIDKVKDHLSQMIIKYKEKKIDKKRQSIN